MDVALHLLNGRRLSLSTRSRKYVLLSLQLGCVVLLHHSKIVGGSGCCSQGVWSKFKTLVAIRFESVIKTFGLSLVHSLILHFDGIVIHDLFNLFGISDLDLLASFDCHVDVNMVNELIHIPIELLEN